MVLRLSTAQADFEDQFQGLLAQKRESAQDVDDRVRTIIDDVIAEGDTALAKYSLLFDRIDYAQIPLRMDTAEIDDACRNCDKQALAALEFACGRIRAYHEKQIPPDSRFTDAAGVELGWRWTPLASAGLYVPGGTASYPSSVLMNAVPAKVAGVERLAMAVPAPDGKINPLVLAAARLAGVSEIYRMGGAQAIAALAYGTQSIVPVDKIVGPGNAYVAAAKRRVFGQVGIDMIAGPSEVLILADATANPDWVAADLLAQAEHDSAAQSLLITSNADLADRVETCVTAQLADLPRRDIATASWNTHGAIIVCDRLENTLPYVDRIAAEHLEIMSEDADALAAKVRNAGAIFIGSFTPEAIGDYVGGSNHVLPTARSARYASGLNLLDFMKRTSILKCSAGSLAHLAPAAIALGNAEGLHAHARSVAIRTNKRAAG